MEPNLIDYYNEQPSCFNTIEKLNEEFNELQIENNDLKLELNEYKIPRIIYSNFKEWNDIKIIVFEKLKNDLFYLIINKEEYLSIYTYHKCTTKFNKIIEDFFKKLLKISDNSLILKWIYNKTSNIVLNINMFLQSMTLYPCKILSNENYLTNIIHDNIKLQITEIIKDIPIFYCNRCKLLKNIIDEENICCECFLNT